MQFEVRQRLRVQDRLQLRIGDMQPERAIRQTGGDSIRRPRLVHRDLRQIQITRCATLLRGITQHHDSRPQLELLVLFHYHSHFTGVQLHQRAHRECTQPANEFVHEILVELRTGGTTQNLERDCTGRAQS